jgi:formylglycine-generating enzyme required for sulfatase activity
MGSNPAAHNADTDPAISLTHPVEAVEWPKAAEFARRLNLMLPSETEWEYACRAGSEAAYAWGNDPEVLIGRANVSDQSLTDVDRGRTSIIQRAPWNDGFSHTAPVHALEPNAFGLFGLHGNVSEWCRDWYRPTPSSELDADGGTPDRPNAEKSARDGCWLMPPSAARAAARRRFAPTLKAPSLGLRVTRPVETTEG